MSRLSDLLKQLKKAQQTGGRIRGRHGDPGQGLEYNEINGNYRVTKKIFDVDLARTPQVIRDFKEHVDVHGEAWKANRDNGMINYKAGRFYGRGR